MIAIAHLLAIGLYLAAAALAATAFTRPMHALTSRVLALLGAGVTVHLAVLVALAIGAGHVYVAGLGPSLSLAGFVLAATLLTVEILAHDVSLTLVAAPMAAVPTAIAAMIGFHHAAEPTGVQGAWLVSHIALSFVGIAAFGTAAVAGVMYLFERRELKSGRFDAMFRLFPPLATLDRVNHLAALAGWLGLTVGVVLAVAYSLQYGGMRPAQVAWGVAAWLGVSGVALGRVVRGWQAHRAALWSSVSFTVVVLLYMALRVAGPVAGKFH
ncbi:MAG: cytochrome c biogenesis protein CcsA [Gemmatimonadaceae bacterium]